MRVAVCSAQVPFVRGGTELFADNLVAELERRGHEADLVTVPFARNSGVRVLTHAFLWRLLDLEEAGGHPIDLVLATQFPSYVVRHPKKVVWLSHQFRQAYELDRTELGQFGEGAEDRALRRTIHDLDRLSLGEARGVFVTSRNLADRIDRFLGISADVLPQPPPQDLPYRCEDYGDFILAVGPFDRTSRVDLLLEALALRADVRAVVAGDGPDRGRLEELAHRQGLDGRIEFVRHIDSDSLAELYASCGAVYHAPVEEDYGVVPYQAFLSEKPVVTTTDADVPHDLVADRRTGIVCEPQSAQVAEACSWLLQHRDDARTWGRAGKESAKSVSWSRAIERLLAASGGSEAGTAG